MGLEACPLTQGFSNHTDTRILPDSPQPSLHDLPQIHGACPCSLIRTTHQTLEQGRLKDAHKKVLQAPYKDNPLIYIARPLIIIPILPDEDGSLEYRVGSSNLDDKIHLCLRASPGYKGISPVFHIFVKIIFMFDCSNLYTPSNDDAPSLEVFLRGAR